MQKMETLLYQETNVLAAVHAHQQVEQPATRGTEKRRDTQVQTGAKRQTVSKHNFSLTNPFEQENTTSIKNHRNPFNPHTFPEVYESSNSRFWRAIHEGYRQKST